LDASSSLAFELVCSSAWLPPNGDQAAHFAHVRELSARLSDWSVFLRLVARHHTSVLAQAVLSRSGAVVPAETMSQLTAAARQARFQSLRQVAELNSLVEFFQARGIDVIALKGVALSQLLYRDPAMRPAADVDLLVRPDRFREADGHLVALGYRRTTPAHTLSDARWRAMSVLPHEFSYEARDGALVELHRDACWIPGNVAHFWHHRASVQLGSRLVPILEPNQMLLYLCEHSSLHRWSHVKWLGDVATLLALHGQSRGVELVQLASDLGLERPLALGALLVQRLCHVAIPDEIESLLARQPVVPALAEAAIVAMERTEAALAMRTVREVLAHDRYLLTLLPRTPLSSYVAYRAFSLRRRFWRMLDR
jgi:hypothetical protein